MNVKSMVNVSLKDSKAETNSAEERPGFLVWRLTP